MGKIHSYRPLPLCLTINKSNIHGLGLMATKKIEKGTNLGITHIKNVDYADGLIRTPLGGFLNHSDNPNCAYQMDGDNFRLVAVRKIKSGEEITVSYRGWYDDKLLDTFK